jgi:hypothetical protein
MIGLGLSITQLAVRRLGEQVPQFSPANLFQSGENGAWYDPSDLSTLYQDAAGTIPVTANGQPVGLMLDKSGRNTHAIQTTSTARPTYQTDGTLHWLNFDGVDDFLATLANTPGSNVAQIISGMRVTGTGLGIVAELGNDTTSGDLRTYVTGASNTFVAGLRGPSGTGGQATSARTPPYSAVFFANINGAGFNLNNQILLRTNGADDEGTTFGGYPGVVSAFSTSPLYIGRRTGTAFPLNGRIYGLIVRFGAELSADERDNSEAYLAGKSGVVIV